MGLSLSLAQIKRWGVLGGIAVLEQAIFSSTNFVLNILLARWLLPEEYGAYALGYSAIFFFLQFLTSYMLEPMAVLGPSKYLNNLVGYLISQVRLYLVLIGALSGVLTGIIWFFKYAGWDSLVSDVLSVISISLILLLIPWLLRRVFYILGKVYVALAGSIVYSLIMLILVVFSKQGGFLSSIFSILIIASAGLFCGLFLLMRLKYSGSNKPTFPVTNLLIENWKIGKWLIANSVFVTIAYQAQIWLSASFLGLSESGALRAIQVLIQPMMLTITALTALATPKLSIDFSTGNYKGFTQKTILLSGLMLLFAIFFEFFLLVFNSEIEMLIYKGKYSSFTTLLPIWGMVPIFLAYSSGIQAGLQSAQMPKALLISSIFWALASLGFGIPLTLKMHLWGASWSAILGHLVFVMVITIIYRDRIYLSLTSQKRNR